VAASPRHAADVVEFLSRRGRLSMPAAMRSWKPTVPVAHPRTRPPTGSSRAARPDQRDQLGRRHRLGQPGWRRSATGRRDARRTPPPRCHALEEVSEAGQDGFAVTRVVVSGSEDDLTALADRFA
jgi:hypothetical protein